MNRAEIISGDKKIGLTFGMIALEVWNGILIERKKLGLLDDHKGESALTGTGWLADTFFCGAYNYAYNKRVVAPTQEDVSDMVDDILFNKVDEELKALNNAIEVYNQSQFGLGFKQQTDAVKKKLEENQSQSTLQQSEEQPTEG